MKHLAASQSDLFVADLLKNALVGAVLMALAVWLMRR